MFKDFQGNVPETREVGIVCAFASSSLVCKEVPCVCPGLR